MIKGEQRVIPEKLMSLWLFDKGVSLNAPNIGTSSLLAMVSLDYVGKRNGSPLRVLMRVKS